MKRSWRCWRIAFLCAKGEVRSSSPAGARVREQLSSPHRCSATHNADISHTRARCDHTSLRPHF
jgi:hypothetical protein